MSELTDPPEKNVSPVSLRVERPEYLNTDVLVFEGTDEKTCAAYNQAIIEVTENRLFHQAGPDESKQPPIVNSPGRHIWDSISSGLTTQQLQTFLPKIEGTAQAMLKEPDNPQNVIWFGYT
ncbi:hypothetical protein ACFLZP_00730 [Patescibacteria group bacterium]